MEALGDILGPYSDQIAKIAGTITCLQFLSGVVLMNDIRKIGKSDSYPPEPLIIGVVLSILSIKFGVLINDATMTNVNIFGVVVSLVFMTIFYLFASNEFRTKIWSKTGYAASFTMICLAYSNFEDPAKLPFRFSMLITTILVVLVGSPLLNLGEVIRKKSTEGMPFPLILAGTFVAASWAVYGISIKNRTVFYQNLLLLSLSIIQLALFAIYPNTSTEKEKPKSKEANDSKKTK